MWRRKDEFVGLSCGGIVWCRRLKQKYDIKRLALVGILFLLVGCFSKETTDAGKAYKYWSGSKPPKDIQLLNGQYYQSPHFTVEYELFLKFKSNKKWFDAFIAYNRLVKDTTRSEWNRWIELPEWFLPDNSYEIYAKDPMDEFERSRYLRHPKTGSSYIYETVGM